jgi:eukaryotic-like serine/threonine-protein kinase
MSGFGKYRLLRKLGAGGMAEAYLAEQEGHAGFARTVVVKRVLPHLADRPEFTRMLVHEARVAARLQHDNIAQIYDLGHVGETYFITMEYVAGLELSTLCELAEVKQRTPLPLGAVARIILDVCAGLDHAHRATDTLGRPLGLVHRDVSPPNIMVTREGVTKIIDFGVAKATEEAGETATGALKGKHAYMSPEQVRGHEVDARSDQFAVGVLLWELVTGRRLFKRDADFLTVRAVVEDEAPALTRVRPELPERLEHIAARALEKDPDDRYASCEQLGDDLEDLARRSGWDVTSRGLGRLVGELTK